jgi:uncharacterized membrane protein
MYLWLKLAHLVAVLLLATGDIGSLLVATRARRAATTLEVVTLMRMHHFTVMAGIIPGAIGSLVTGAWLVHLASMSFTSTWVAGSFIAWAASLAVGVGLLVPAESRALKEGAQLLTSGTSSPSEALRRAVGAPVVWIGEWTTVALLLAMTALMVLKPA